MKKQKRLAGPPFFAGMPLSPEAVKRFMEDDFDDSIVSAGSPNTWKYPERYGPEQSLYTNMPGKPLGVALPPKETEPKKAVKRKRKPAAKKPAHAA